MFSAGSRVLDQLSPPKPSCTLLLSPAFTLPTVSSDYPPPRMRVGGIPAWALHACKGACMATPPPPPRGATLSGVTCTCSLYT
ncbi:hypothetical protein OAO87_01500 [bacterium]|nr:hypothetical protein [bacterium]